jgi:hypothetical protein
MTTGTAIAIGVGVAGVGAVAWYMHSRKRNAALYPGGQIPTLPPPDIGAAVDPFVAAGPMIDPFTSPQIATLPAYRPPPTPMPLPLGVFPPPPVGIAVAAVAGAVMRGSPSPPPPPPPPPIPVATSVGTLYFPPGISQDQAYAKVNDLAAIYASTERPEDDTSYTPPVAVALARSGRGHF